MSRGASRQHLLRPLAGLDDTQMRQEITSWSRALPIGLIGCIVHDTTTRAYLNGVITAFEWDTTEYESDQFFTYVSGAASAMIVPESLGGLYAFELNVVNTTITAFPATLYVRVTDGRTGVPLISNRQSIPSLGATESYAWGQAIPRILVPGDIVEFCMKQIGATVNLGLQAPTTEDPRSPQFTFYRVAPASANT